jgi:hypothetical protein
VFTRAEGRAPRIRRHTTKERDMPQIIVTADHGAAFGEGAVMLRERVTVADFESDHFAMQLVERLGWAVGDADEVERVGERMLDPAEPGEPDTSPAEPIRIPSPA